MATKTKTSIKQKARNVATKTKNYVADKTRKVKKSAVDYGSKLKTAYDVGYVRGYEDAYSLTNASFSHTAGAIGYKTGARDRKRVDKYVGKYNKIKNK